jgi:hypothetical protein
VRSPYLNPPEPGGEEPCRSTRCKGIADTTLKIKQSAWQQNLMCKTLLYALTLDGLLQSVVPLGSRLSLTYGLAAPVSQTTSKPAIYPEL